MGTSGPSAASPATARGAPSENSCHTYPIVHSGTCTMYPRQDSNLRPQDYRSTVFEGSRGLSLALLAQRISPPERYQRLPLIRVAFQSKAMNKRLLGKELAQR